MANNPRGFLFLFFSEEEGNVFVEGGVKRRFGEHKGDITLPALFLKVAAEQIASRANRSFSIDQQRSGGCTVSCAAC